MLEVATELLPVSSGLLFIGSLSDLMRDLGLSDAEGGLLPLLLDALSAVEPTVSGGVDLVFVVGNVMRGFLESGSIFIFGVADEDDEA